MDIPSAAGPTASARCASARTSPTCATRPTGRATCRAPRHRQLRPHHRQDLQGQHRPARGLKAGEFDLMRFFSAGDWARRVNGKRFDSGELVKAEFTHRLPTGFPELCAQHPPPAAGRHPGARGAGPGAGLRVDEPADVLQRLPAGAGPVRQHRLRGQGPARADELALLEPWRAQLPPAVFGPGLPPPPHRRRPSLRGNLRRRRRCCARPAGRCRTGCATPRGEALVLEYLDSNEAGAGWSRPGHATWKARHRAALRWSTSRCTSSACAPSISTSSRIALRRHPQPGHRIRRPVRQRGGRPEDSGNLAGVPARRWTPDRPAW
jgi:microcin C transport system substrate-binding protein